jgi:hypothetical protein
MSLKVCTFTDMIEQQPNRPPPIPESQHTPHEGGNGSPGIPPTLHERAKPPPESPAHEGSHSTHVQPKQPDVYREYDFSDEHYLEKIRALYESDRNLFATRAMEALDTLLNVRVPHAEQLDESNRQELIDYLHANGGSRGVDSGELLYRASNRSEIRGYANGLKTAFQILSERIIGEPTGVRLPSEEKPQGQSQ